MDPTPHRKYDEFSMSFNHKLIETLRNAVEKCSVGSAVCNLWILLGCICIVYALSLPASSSRNMEGEGRVRATRRQLDFLAERADEYCILIFNGRLSVEEYWRYVNKWCNDHGSNYSEYTHDAWGNPFILRKEPEYKYYVFSIRSRGSSPNPQDNTTLTRYILCDCDI